MEKLVLKVPNDQNWKDFSSQLLRQYVNLHFDVNHVPPTNEYKAKLAIVESRIVSLKVNIGWMDWRFFTTDKVLKTKAFLESFPSLSSLELVEPREPWYNISENFPTFNITKIQTLKISAMSFSFAINVLRLFPQGTYLRFLVIVKKDLMYSCKKNDTVAVIRSFINIMEELMNGKHCPQSCELKFGQIHAQNQPSKQIESLKMINNSNQISVFGQFGRKYMSVFIDILTNLTQLNDLTIEFTPDISSTWSAFQQPCPALLRSCEGLKMLTISDENIKSEMQFLMNIVENRKDSLE